MSLLLKRRIVSSNEFNIGNTFYTQVGYSGANSPVLLMWEFKMKYWFIANENRFFVIVRVYDRYFVCSAGILQTYATEAQWGQPHYVAGCTYTPLHWSDYNGTIRNFPDGSAASNGSFNAMMRVFKPDLLWSSASNWYTSGDHGQFPNTVADTLQIWPHGENRIQSGTIHSGSVLTQNHGNLYKWMMPGPEAAGPTYPLLPIQVYRREGASQAIYGTIPGVYMTTGGWMAGEISAAGVTGIDNPNRLANEDIITVGPDQYLCVPIVPYERRRNYWSAFKLE
jgi:hypothetical protein